MSYGRSKGRQCSYCQLTIRAEALLLLRLGVLPLGRNRLGGDHYEANFGPDIFVRKVKSYSNTLALLNLHWQRTNSCRWIRWVNRRGIDNSPFDFEVVLT